MALSSVFCWSLRCVRRPRKQGNIPPTLAWYSSGPQLQPRHQQTRPQQATHHLPLRLSLRQPGAGQLSLPPGRAGPDLQSGRVSPLPGCLRCRTQTGRAAPGGAGGAGGGEASPAGRSSDQLQQLCRLDCSAPGSEERTRQDDQVSTVQCLAELDVAFNRDLYRLLLDWGAETVTSQNSTLSVTTRSMSRKLQAADLTLRAR